MITLAVTLIRRRLVDGTAAVILGGMLGLIAFQDRKPVKSFVGFVWDKAEKLGDVIQAPFYFVGSFEWRALRSWFWEHKWYFFVFIVGGILTNVFIPKFFGP